MPNKTPLGIFVTNIMFPEQTYNEINLIPVSLLAMCQRYLHVFYYHIQNLNLFLTVEFSLGKMLTYLHVTCRHFYSTDFPELIEAFESDSLMYHHVILSMLIVTYSIIKTILSVRRRRNPFSLKIKLILKVSVCNSLRG